MIEILVLQSLTDQAGGDTPRALTQLVEALTLAEQKGYVRVFVDEGPQMKSLLTAVFNKRGGWNYVRRLLPASAMTTELPPQHPPANRDPAAAKVSSKPSAIANQDVLRLLATDLDGPDIARRLFVSLNTMRTHTRSIYAKLGVTADGQRSVGPKS